MILFDSANVKRSPDQTIKTEARFDSQAFQREQSLDYFYEKCFDDSSVSEDLLASELCQDPSGFSDSASPDIPGAFATAQRNAVLSNEQEYRLFRRLNYLKHLQTTAYAAEAQSLEEKVLQTRNQIVEANMRLVFSIVKKLAAPGSLEFDDFMSAGYTALIRAVDLFDFRRKSKFSTYAYTSIQRACFGHYRKENRHRERFRVENDVDTQHLTIDGIDATISHEDFKTVKKLLEQLKPREQYILMARLGLSGDHDGLTFRTIGKELGISGTRAAQLFRDSIERLRSSMN